MQKSFQVLKYPGSKQRLAGWVISHMSIHHSYLETYFGSGAVLLNKARSPIETVNDIDGDVTNLFTCIRDHAHELASLVAGTPYARQEYDNAFKHDECEPLEQARRFLIRCWMAAGPRTGMKNGWKNDVVGREAAYAVRNWYRLPQWIESVADRLRLVQIENMPAVDLIQRFNNSNVFIYANPPYLPSLRMKNLYRYEMTEDDHIQLLEVLMRHTGPVMLSGYDNELYDTMLTGWKKCNIKTTAERGASRVETIWMNYVENQLSIFGGDFLE